MLLSRMDTPVMRGGSVTQTLRSVGRSSSVGLPVTLRRNSTKFGHRSRVDLGSISVGSRISGRSRVDLGSISGRSRVDLESISSRSRSTQIKITSSSSDLPVKSIGRVSLLRTGRSIWAATSCALAAQPAAVHVEERLHCCTHKRRNQSKCFQTPGGAVGL